VQRGDTHRTQWGHRTQRGHTQSHPCIPRAPRAQRALTRTQRGHTVEHPTATWGHTKATFRQHIQRTQRTQTVAHSTETQVIERPHSAQRAGTQPARKLTVMQPAGHTGREHAPRTIDF